MLSHCTYTTMSAHVQATPADYLYRSGSFRWDVESGMWGIFRVLRGGLGHKCKNACRKLFQRMCK